MISDLHRTLGSLTTPAAVLIALVAFGAFLVGTRPLGRTVARVLDVTVIGAVALIMVATVAGGLIFVGGKEPKEILHLVYGVAALAALPIAAALGVRAVHGGGRSQTRYLWIAGGAFALVGLALRLTQTG